MQSAALPTVTVACLLPSSEPALTAKFPNVNVVIPAFVDDAGA